MGDLNKQPVPFDNPEMPDVVKSVMDEPMHQPRYNIKHYIGDALSIDAFRDAAQYTVNTAWTRINPLAEAPVLHDPLTLEDEWNIRRSAMFLVLGRDIGEYPGDEFFKDGAPVYQHSRYKFMEQMFDANVGRKPAIASMERVPIRLFASITPSETSIDLHNKK